MLGKLKVESSHLFQAWWCRGHGAAVLLLLATVLLFRDARDVIFWIAIGFFVFHTATSVRRYRSERRVRARAVVVARHSPHVPPAAPPAPCGCARVIFEPAPINGLISLKIPHTLASWQTKNHL